MQEADGSIQAPVTEETLLGLAKNRQYPDLIRGMISFTEKYLWEGDSLEIKKLALFNLAQRIFNLLDPQNSRQKGISSPREINGPGWVIRRRLAKAQSIVFTFRDPKDEKDWLSGLCLVKSGKELTVLLTLPSSEKKVW